VRESERRLYLLERR